MTTRLLKWALCSLIIPVLFAACLKEEEAPFGPDNLHEVVFHAGWEPETKTVLQQDGSVWWSPGDEIALFVNGQKYCLKADCTEPTPTTDFIGKIGNGSGPYYAIYPYDKAVSETDFSIPSVQYAKSGGFAPGQFVSFAITDNETLSFQNACGGIKFSVASEGINKVVFTSRRFYEATYSISGEFGASETSGSLDADGSSKITVYPLEGESFTPGKHYYVAMIPTKLPHLEMTFYKGDSFATYICSNALFANWGEIKRGVVNRLLEKDKDLEFVKLEHTYARMSGVDMWPLGTEAQTVTEINFNTSCETLKGEPVRSSIGHEGFSPVYAEINGTVVNFYTEAEFYLMDDYLSFGSMSSLKELDLSKVDTRNLTTCSFSDCESLEKVDLSNFNTSNMTEMSHMFYNCRSLENLDLSSFNMANVSIMYHMFGLCTNLKSINLCNAEPGQLKNNANVGNLFYNCKNLTKVDLGRLDLSGADCESAMLRFAKCSNNCAVLCTPETRARLCQNDTQFISEDIISWYVPGENLPDVVEPKRKPELYYSSDFSMNKKIKLLQQATVGAGIDIILVGEAYSDRLISDGTYENDMTTTMESIFSVEPLKTYRNLFNVYMIYAVSKNEVIDEDTAFDYYNEELHDDFARFGEHGLTAYFDVLALNKYSNLVIRDNTPKHLTRIIVVHDNRYEGIAMMHPLCETDDEVAHNCPTGIDGIAVVHRIDSDDLFRYVVCHEFGHAFAALYEEYVDREWSMPAEGYNTDNKAYFQKMQNQHGWWSNIDFTNDPQSVRWHSFMADSRYDESNVSIIEGARYAYGVWRSMNESIMGTTYGHYSVPAREAIYKVINKLAYGDSWQYDYEAFVQQDLKNLLPPSQLPEFGLSHSASNRRQSLFKIEESTDAIGKKRVTVIMN